MELWMQYSLAAQGNKEDQHASQMVWTMTSVRLLADILHAQSVAAAPQNTTGVKTSMISLAQCRKQRKYFRPFRLMYVSKPACFMARRIPSSMLPVMPASSAIATTLGIEFVTATL
jgi:hypothetical protein